MSNEEGKLRPWNTMREASMYLRISQRTLARRIREGLLTVRKDGHLVRISRASILAYEIDR
jgi:excisionase family DNA binding protein